MYHSQINTLQVIILQLQSWLQMVSHSIEKAEQLSGALEGYP